MFYGVYGEYEKLGDYRNIGNLSQASLNTMTITNSGFILTLTKPKLTSTNPKLTRNPNLKP